MPQLVLYDTLTRARRPFTSLEPGSVRMYTCGPTVYRYVHIGNLRSFMLADWLRRTLTGLGYTVRHVKNVTDVGHMRQELLDAGEDRMIAAARAEGKSAAQIAAFYTDAFLEDERRLNILPPTVLPHATEHIPQMIAIIEQLLNRGLAYNVAGNIYFNVAAFPSYGSLSGNTIDSVALQAGVRSEVDPAKQRPEDFALWKAAEPNRDPAMTWASPWGPGFPGWHIECSAMSRTHLGEQLDIHTGGVDNIFPHHEGEIAQSEGATEKKYVNFWVHGQHLLVDGLKMAKSTGNDYRLSDLAARGYDPLAFRYLCATVHYRSRLNFTFTALGAAQQGLNRLRELVTLNEPATSDERIFAPFTTFTATLADDLHVPRALAILWHAIATLPPADGAALALACDSVLGFGLSAWRMLAQERGESAMALLTQREQARHQGDFVTADLLREHITAAGLHVHDTPNGPRAHGAPPAQPGRGRITSSSEVPTRLDQPDEYDFTVSLVGRGQSDEVVRAHKAIRATQGAYRIQIVALDNGSPAHDSATLRELAATDPDFIALLADHDMGEGAGRNATFRRATGRVLVWLGNHVEPTGDVWTPLLQALAGRGVAQPIGAAGGWGLTTADRKDFFPSQGQRVDALEGYLFAFPRQLLRATGWLDEKFRFYRNLDIDMSFRIRKAGYALAEIPDLPVRVHPHRIWESLSDGERQRRSKKNFDRFYREWHHWRDSAGVLIYIEDFIRRH